MIHCEPYVRVGAMSCADWRPRVHSLRDNDIGDEGAQALAGTLPQCAALQSLECVGREGAACERAVAMCGHADAWQALCKGRDGAVSGWCSRARSLGSNGIFDEGAQALASALPQCAGLQTVKCVTWRGLRLAGALPFPADAVSTVPAGRGGELRAVGGVGHSGFASTTLATRAGRRSWACCRSARRFRPSSKRRGASCSRSAHER